MYELRENISDNRSDAANISDESKPLYSHVDEDKDILQCAERIITGLNYISDAARRYFTKCDIDGKICEYMNIPELSEEILTKYMMREYVMESCMWKWKEYEPWPDSIRARAIAQILGGPRDTAESMGLLDVYVLWERPFVMSVTKMSTYNIKICPTTRGFCYYMKK